MYKEVLQHTGNLAIWPVMSFVIFFSFFIGLVWWAVTADRGYVKEMSELPLEDEQQSNQ